MHENISAIFIYGTIIYRTKTSYIFFCKQFDIFRLQRYLFFNLSFLSPFEMTMGFYYLPKITAALQPPKPDAVFKKFLAFNRVGVEHTLTLSVSAPSLKPMVEI